MAMMRKKLGKLITTSTKAADTENQVLRRLLATLFVLGLMPTRHDPAAKRVVLQGEGEWAALFYQHGVGQPLAVAKAKAPQRFSFGVAADALGEHRALIARAVLRADEQRVGQAWA